jgi:hypothetical protein
MSPLWPTLVLAGLALVVPVWLWRGRQQSATVSRMYAAYDAEMRMLPRTPDGGAETETPDLALAPPSGLHSTKAAAHSPAHGAARTAARSGAHRARAVLVLADGPSQQEPRIAC